jgi:hypothetical protein
MKGMKEMKEMKGMKGMKGMKIIWEFENEEMEDKIIKARDQFKKYQKRWNL